MKQQKHEVTKPRVNQVQEMDAVNKSEAVAEKGAVTKYVVYKAGASTTQNTHHKFGTSREKHMVLARS